MSVEEKRFVPFLVSFECRSRGRWARGGRRRLGLRREEEEVEQLVEERRERNLRKGFLSVFVESSS